MASESADGDSPEGDRESARQWFIDLIGLGEPFDLTEVALAIALEERPEIDLDDSRDSLQELITNYREVRQTTGPASTRDEARLLCRFLAEEQGYQGNQDEYYDPDNSFLDQVLERRMGIPISLALLYLHVGRGVGLDIQGIGFPGHFLVRVMVDGEAVLIDPFAGKLVAEAELRQLLDRLQGPEAELEDRFSQPISTKEFVLRMLNNLIAIYQQRSDHPRLLGCCDRLLLVDPDNTQALLLRIGVYQQLKMRPLALAELGRLRGKVANPEFRQHIERMMLEIDLDQESMQ